MMGEKNRDSNVDTIDFTTFNSFIGLIVGLNSNNDRLKTLGAFVDTCETSVYANELLDRLGG
jgi:hypothetical protein